MEFLVIPYIPLTIEMDMMNCLTACLFEYFEDIGTVLGILLVTDCEPDSFSRTLSLQTDFGAHFACLKLEVVHGSLATFSLLRRSNLGLADLITFSLMVTHY